MISNLKGIYQAFTIEEAELILEIFKIEMGQKTPHHHQVFGKQLQHTSNILMKLC
jgi:hypothetical protein